MQQATPGLEYTLINDDTEYRVSQGTAVHEATLQAIRSGTRVEIIIPECKDGIRVSSIGDFGYCKSLFSISIPPGVNSIYKYAFVGCTGLENVTIPDGVTVIEPGTFSGCSSLMKVTLPNSVAAIGNNAFRGCSRLETVTIPEGVTSIGSYAFYECTGLKAIHFKPHMAPHIPRDFIDFLPYKCSVHIPSSGEGYADLLWTEP